MVVDIRNSTWYNAGIQATHKQNILGARTLGHSVSSCLYNLAPSFFGVPKMPAFNPQATDPQTGRKRARRYYPIAQSCSKCGALPENERIARHHKDGNTFNNTEENIEWLCFACHLATHGHMDSRKRKREQRADTEYRPGDKCPECGGRLYSVQTFYSRQDGLRYVYIACPARYGGCGHRAGSYTTPAAGR